MKVEILNYLKPKVASLGFNKDELEGIIDSLNGNLQLKDDATEEDKDAAIKAVCDAALPFLQTAQKVSSRVINKYKEDNPIEKPTEKKEPPKEGDEMPKWFSDYKAEQDKKYSDLVAEQKNKAYSERLKERLKDVPAKFYNVAANGKVFESDEKFEEFCVSIETDFADYAKEVGITRLSNGHKPGAGGSTKTEMENLASQITEGTKQIVESKKTS